MKKKLVRTSKFLSLVLRHDPGSIGLTLDPEGWASVPELLEKMALAGHEIERAWLKEVVATNDKKRFVFSADGQRLRASQGHSVDVELGLQPVVPPATLFHGTVDRFLDSIRVQGLVPGKRQHVHLSADRAVAESVGGRRGKPVLLLIAAGELHAGGHEFYLSENGVWLTSHVPAGSIAFPPD